jgi:hypothetical protein
LDVSVYQPHGVPLDMSIARWKIGTFLQVNVVVFN